MYKAWASPVVLVLEKPPANAGDIREVSLISGLGKFPGGEHIDPLQYSCLENSMHRGTQQATIYRLEIHRLQICRTDRFKGLLDLADRLL